MFEAQTLEKKASGPVSEIFLDSEGVNIWHGASECLFFWRHISSQFTRIQNITGEGKNFSYARSDLDLYYLAHHLLTDFINLLKIKGTFHLRSLLYIFLLGSLCHLLLDQTVLKTFIS